MLDAAITGFSNRAAAFAASRRTSIGNGELEIAVLRRFPPMQFDEKSVQKLSGLAIIKVCALHIPDQDRLRIALIHACVHSVGLGLIDEAIMFQNHWYLPFVKDAHEHFEQLDV